MMFLASIIVGIATAEIYGECYGWLAFGLSLFVRSLILRLSNSKKT